MRAREIMDDFFGEEISNSPKTHRTALLEKLASAWERTPSKTLMEVMQDHLPEEDIFWTSDEHLMLRLDGIDPYNEEKD